MFYGVNSDFCSMFNMHLIFILSFYPIVLIIFLKRRIITKSRIKLLKRSNIMAVDYK